jgi:hypothetical protein
MFIIFDKDTKPGELAEANGGAVESIEKILIANG